MRKIFIPLEKNYTVKKPGSPTGFTLIELVVVISIIAILAGIIAPNAFKAIEKAKIVTIIATAKTLKTATSVHYTDTGRYATEYCVENYPTGTYPQYHMLSVAQTYSGWNGPYIEIPLSNNLNPFRRTTYIYNNLSTLGSYRPYGFDLDGDGSVDRNGSGNFLSMAGTPEAIARQADEKIDEGVPGNWNNTGAIEYQWLPSVAIMIYLVGGY